MSEHEKDLLYEGRREAYLDIDRMINEGMAGGTVREYGSPQIGATIELPKEEPPRKNDDKEQFMTARATCSGFFKRKFLLQEKLS